MKMNYISIIFPILLITIINSKYQTKSSNDKREEQDMMEKLQELEEDIKDLNKDIAKYDTLIYILIPTVCILVIIFIAILIYELIKRCNNRENKQKIIETTGYTKTFDPDNYNYSEIKDTTTNTTSPKGTDSVQNSLQASNMSKELDSNKYNNDSNNIQNEKPKLKESNNINNIKDISMSGAVAPAIQDTLTYTNKNDEFFTNKGTDDNNNKSIMSNPYK